MRRRGGAPSGSVDCDPVPAATVCGTAHGPQFPHLFKEGLSWPHPELPAALPGAESPPWPWPWPWPSACRQRRPLWGRPCTWSRPKEREPAAAAELHFTSGFFFFIPPHPPCSWLSFGKVLKSWKVEAVLPARGWAGWQPKPELGFDFIFSFSG